MAWAQDLRICLKANDPAYFKNFKRLKTHLDSQNKELVFAMNAGMCQQNHEPLGLYIENELLKNGTNYQKTGYGNFYMQPNGIFYIDTKNKAHVSVTKNIDLTNIRLATQSGPMLVINGKINAKFNQF